MQAQDRLSEFKTDEIRQPAVFIGHGSPMVAIEFDQWNENICKFLEEIPRPKAIVIVSAHWETENTIQITGSEFPEQIYDFDPDIYPETLFQLTYPCMGYPELANNICEIFLDNGFDATLVDDRGLDHGAWIPMYVAFPDMDIPIIQISLPKNAKILQVFNMGKTLASLRKTGVLLIGSGNIVNNKDLSDLSEKYAEADSWAIEFDVWFNERLTNFKIDELMRFESEAPHVEKVNANKSHILPLFFVLGAMLQSDHLFSLYDGFQYGNISMRSFALIDK